jgi:ABC-type cobalamin transport system ATPase subunit
MYQVQSDSQHAKLHAVKFGVQAGQFMHILSGAKAGEQFIISDLTSLHANTQEITIN